MSSTSQGFLVAILFCFMNGEVRGEFRKKYRRFQLRRGSYIGGASLHHSNWTTTNTYVGSYQKNGKSQPPAIGLHENGVGGHKANGDVCKSYSIQTTQSAESNEEGYVVLKNVISENSARSPADDKVTDESHITETKADVIEVDEERERKCAEYINLMRERESPTTSARKDSGYEEYTPMIQTTEK